MTTTPCNSELWLSYNQVSRANRPTTTQLIELEFQNHKLTDLESVLEHVFRQGYVDPKFRSATWWERRDGCKVKSSQCVDELLKQGVGRCRESALKLVIADMPPAMWFKYVYASCTTGHVVAQRIKFDTVPTRFECLAHVTNYIFAQGWLPAKLRSLVHWQDQCGKKIDECTRVEELLSGGVGVCEDKPLSLFIDNATKHCQCSCH